MKVWTRAKRDPLHFITDTQYVLARTTGDIPATGWQTCMPLGLKNPIPLSSTWKKIEGKWSKWKDYHTKRETKRRRKYKQKETDVRLMYENQTSAEYTSGIGLDIGAPGTGNSTPQTQKRKNCVECRHSLSKTHLTSTSLECPYNEKNIEKYRHLDKQQHILCETSKTNNY